MATKITKPTENDFDRAPFVFERKEVDNFGNEVSNLFYSVKGRKQEFAFLYKDGRFETEIVKLTDTFAVVCCKVYLNANDTFPKAIAHASREYDKLSEIGKRFVECAETAAIGRALDNAGIGADAFLDSDDKSAYEELLGSPVARMPDAAPEKSQGEPAAKAAPKTPKNATIPKTEAEAMMVIIQTTESSTLKGKTFAEAISLAKDIVKFTAFLTELTEHGMNAEKAAANILLPKFEPKNDTTGDAA